MFTELAPGVFAVDHRVVEGKNGVIFGRRIALAIDTGIDPEEGQAVAEFIRSRGMTPDRLALTHGHGDHVLGGAALAGGEVFAHSAAPAVIGRHLPGWAERAGLAPEEMAARLPMPTVTFSEELRIDLGGRIARLFPAPGHSEDGICVLLEVERILFAGDSVVTGIVPAIGDGDSRTLEASLRRLAGMEIDVLVAGHGPILKGAERVRAWIEWLAQYLAGIRAAVQAELDQGCDPATVADRVEFRAFIGDRLPQDRHGMPRRHRDTVEKIIAEAVQEREYVR
jgi:glyoxylase-like metal-dependent hydrolase (beta-lactamase superfamily II)